MKINQLICDLIKLQKKFGNIEVTSYNRENAEFNPIHKFYLLEDKEEIIIGVNLSSDSSKIVEAEFSNDII